jgi:hypothetical protein
MRSLKPCEVLVLGTLLSPLTAPLPAASVFFDGFEVGSTCAWSSETGSGPCCGALLFEENWNIPDAPAWPAPWVELADSLEVADVASGRGRLRPVPAKYPLGRVWAPLTETNFEVLVTMTLEDASSQSPGLYVRQNGGYLDVTAPPGSGYGAFVDSAGPSLTLYKEQEGVEISFNPTSVAPLVAFQGYRIRLQVESFGAEFGGGGAAAVAAGDTSLGGTTTHWRARYWTVGAPEPATWTVEATDVSELTALVGGISLDSWSNHFEDPITTHTLYDNLQVFKYCE